MPRVMFNRTFERRVYLAVAVATGPSFALADLEALDPDLLLTDLRDTDAFLTWLESRRA